MMHQPDSRGLDHFYRFGDVYETLDTCQELELLLGRLRRQNLISDRDLLLSRQNLAEIRSHVESRLPAAS